MNDLTLLREAGPEAPPFTPAARSAARAALLDEIAGPAPRRSRRPGRRVVLRLGAAVVAAAAAWTGAVLVAAPDGPGAPADSVTLVDFAMPTFPLTPDPVPDGLRPAFDGDGTGASIAAYDDATGAHGFTLYVSEDEPEGIGDEGAPGFDLEASTEVSVDGREADLVRYSREWCTGDQATGCGHRSFTRLQWERADDQWVVVLAHGRYRAPERVLAIAESLVDRPQPAVLDIGLAPAGWSVQAFKMGRVLSLVNDSYEQQTLTVHLPLPEDVVPPDQLLDQLMGPVGPVVPVTVHGRPAQLVLCDAGYLGQRIWYLQAQFEDGTTFTLQVPDAFTQEQVVQFAEQVTHNP
ncbi:hypothetical protein [Blastococcus sp. TF02A-35]|uniref:hypothetical protein n=1 Tax=Blastococcus sp. TF02A-35 TaxID=2559612 RepID=UPI0010746B64|nr:hypothetical protein [Blastococcus sp. TF02A_35]TFV45993.1 hypothetical protein E4P43_16910 [Blastococcus sp. TF02A_35]